MIVTKVFIGLNLLMFLFEISSRGGSLFSTNLNQVEVDYGLVPFLVHQGEWYRIFTSGFIHFGLLHLGLNMVVIYQASLMLEPTLGPIRYFCTYVCCLIGGSAGALILADNPRTITAGASGVAFGLVGCAVAGMMARKIPIMQTGLGGLLVINLVLTFAIPGLSIGGHLGGLAAGFICGVVLLRPRRGPAPAWDVLVPIGLGVAGFALCLWGAQRAVEQALVLVPLLTR
jgi:membrane associated rhomboid family serine protease